MPSEKRFPINRHVKVLAVGWGTTGDISPALFVASELGRRGYDAHFIGNPYFEKLAIREGVAFTGVGRREDHDRLLADSDLFYRERKSPYQARLEHYFPFMQQLFDATESLAEPGRTILLHGEEASVSAAEKLGLPRVKIILAPCLSPSRFDPPYPERILPPWASFLSRTPGGIRLLWQLNSLRHGRRGISPTPTQQPNWPDDHPISVFRKRAGLPVKKELKPRLFLCIWPDWLASPQHDWPENFRTTGFIFPPQTRKTDDHDDPVPGREPARRPIVFTTGSVASGQEAFYTAAIEACQRLKQSGQLVTSNPDQVPPNIPPDIEYAEHAPFEQLFPQSALVVHHGGIGTAALALAAGIPQILCPLRGDQFDNANRLQRLGVGKMIDMRRINPGSMIDAIRVTLGSTAVARRCDYWRQRVKKEDGLRYAADLVEDVCREEIGAAPSF